MNKLLRLRLLNSDRALSLTNVAVYATLFKLILSGSPTVIDWLTLTTALGCYNFKRWFESRQLTERDAMEARLVAMENAIAQVRSVLALKRGN